VLEGMPVGQAAAIGLFKSMVVPCDRFRFAPPIARQNSFEVFDLWRGLAFSLFAS
jgi:hypothetical protein